ncbi:MAG: Acetyl-CoA decarbonylase/synthase complex subunit delta 1 [Candidatus Argoarchaeum ethanivorans]|uniref:Acetyl-CoA decarbonylase/synthase complex subunit delta 1 n=1 Tax=Candidatus Argoarchaeum ethanivorans TaxID=2608793 RepID=A0A811T7A5_9EURY|nr:MAG: Acetyl-CoA decarbonylase/synthase complex subunit delta 1 [Candidatus Argoarchaeum ethanivorans]
MSKKLTLAEVIELLNNVEIEALEGVTFEGDIEIEIDESVMNFREEANKLIESRFAVGTVKEWTTAIEEVTIGATPASGGSRGHTVTVGGEKALPYYFDSEMKNPTCVVAIDVFDMPIQLAKSVRTSYEDVMESPSDWAKKVVSEYHADMIALHLISTDPKRKDTSASDASKTVEDVLQAVDVPIIISGSGTHKKDPEVLEKAAEVSEGERCLIASANPDNDYERVARAANQYGHVLLSWTQLEINAQKELNRKLIKHCEVSRDRIVMDPTTAALGYGLDYAYSNVERIRLAGLTGDKELNFPTLSVSSNAWNAREAWMISSPLKEDSNWGEREHRGLIWEAATGFALALAGCELFMMMHPGSAQLLKKITRMLGGSINEEKTDLSNWITKLII